MQTEQTKEMIFLNIKEEMKEHKAKIKKLRNQISNCYNAELKQHLEYELQQEELKLESCVLLLDLARKAGNGYE